MLRGEVLLFTRNANNVGNQVKITLNIDIYISRITNNYDVLWSSIPKLGFIWKKIGKKLISTDYGSMGLNIHQKKSKEG